MAEVFGAVLSIKDNVSGVMKQAKESATGFRGEVNKVKKDLNNLDKQKLKEKELKIKNSAAYKAIDNVKKKLEPITNKIITLKAKEEHAVGKIKKVKAQLDKIKDNKVVQIGVKGASVAGKALAGLAVAGTVAAFTAVSVASVAAVKNAADFQSQMQNVGTLLDGDVSGKLQRMGKDVKQIALDTGLATSDLTDGLYQVVSAFGESAESAKQLEIAAKAAKAGNSTTTDSINLLSAVTKGYGDTSAQAMQKASDLAFMTVKLGQTSFPELASSIGQVVPLASTLKVSQEELFGAMSTLTGVTGSTSEVTTQLKATMQGFLSPSSNMEKALKKMGYASGAAALESEGLGGILTKLKESVNGDEVAFANLFSSVEAKNAVLALVGNQAENFTTKTEEMYKASGAADKAFKTQTASVKEMAAKLKNAGSVMLTSLGEKALPYIQSALDKVIAKMPELTENISGVIEKAAPVFEKIASNISGFIAKVEPVVISVADKFKNAFVQSAPALLSFKDSISQAFTAAEPALVAFATLAASTIPVIADILSGLGSVVATVMPTISAIVVDVCGMVSDAFGGTTKSAGLLQQIFEVAGPAISGILKTAWSVIGPILDLALQGIGLVADAVGWAFPYIQGVVVSVWKVIEPIYNGIGNAISTVSGAVKKLRGVDSGETSDRTAGGGGVKPKANATGTSFFTGGWTQVGEHGPELMRLPAGTQIKSHSSSDMLGSSKKFEVNIAHMEVRNDTDIDRVAEEIVKKLEEAEDNA